MIVMVIMIVYVLAGATIVRAVGWGQSKSKTRNNQLTIVFCIISGTSHHTHKKRRSGTVQCTW